MKHTDERSHKESYNAEAPKRDLPHRNVEFDQRIFEVRKELGYVFACLWWYVNNHDAEITLLCVHVVAKFLDGILVVDVEHVGLQRPFADAVVG